MPLTASTRLPTYFLLALRRLQVIAEVPKGSKGVVGCTPLIKPGECFEYYR